MMKPYVVVTVTQITISDVLITVKTVTLYLPKVQLLVLYNAMSTMSQ